jgi:hypothetical protein
LRQRAQEKDEQLSKLSKDREEMRNKLSELTKLVQQLLAEKESLCKIIHGIPIEHSVGNTSVNYKPQEEEGIVKITLELNYCSGYVCEAKLYVVICIFVSMCDMLFLLIFSFKYWSLEAV